MPKRITIAPHLSLDELENRYRQAKEPVQRSHYQIIWLLACGRPTEEVAAITSYSRNWIYEIVWGYNRVGPETLGDGRHQNPGPKPKLDDVQQANLLQALRGPAPDGGLWNGRKVADYLSQLISEPISRQQGWEYLKQMRLRRRVPRQSHQETNPEEQETWKKKLATVVEQVQKEYPDADVEEECEDEQRKRATTSDTSALGGRGGATDRGCQLETRVAVVVWLCSTPDGGNLLVDSEAESPDRVLCPANPRPYVNTKLFSRVLKDFAQHFGVGKNKRIILPLDQAGWHMSEQLEVPEGIHLVPLPPYSPELQPAERLWPLVNEPLANEAFKTIAEMEELVAQRCSRLLKQQKLIRGLTFYHWWPEVEAVA